MLLKNQEEVDNGITAIMDTLLKDLKKYIQKKISGRKSLYIVKKCYTRDLENSQLSLLRSYQILSLGKFLCKSGSQVNRSHLFGIYKGARGEAGRPLQGAPGGGVLLLVGVGLPFPTPTRRWEGRRIGRRKGGRRPPFPSSIGTRGGGGTRPALAGPLSLH